MLHFSKKKREQGTVGLGLALEGVGKESQRDARWRKRDMIKGG